MAMFIWRLLVLMSTLIAVMNFLYAFGGPMLSPYISVATTQNPDFTMIDGQLMGASTNQTTLSSQNQNFYFLGWNVLAPIWGPIQTYLQLGPIGPLLTTLFNGIAPSAMILALVAVGSVACTATASYEIVNFIRAFVG
jgi:hypothetical protein